MFRFPFTQQPGSNPRVLLRMSARLPDGRLSAHCRCYAPQNLAKRREVVMNANRAKTHSSPKTQQSRRAGAASAPQESDSLVRSNFPELIGKTITFIDYRKSPEGWYGLEIGLNDGSIFHLELHPTIETRAELLALRKGTLKRVKRYGIVSPDGPEGA
jgi:hypothetical protein